MRNVGLMLHPSRLAQIKQLGEAWGLTMSETVERLLFKEVERGTIPDELPGVKIEREGEGLLDLNGVIIITINGLDPVTLTYSEVRELTRRFTFLPKDGERIQGFSLDLENGGRWFLARVGRGFVHAVTDAAGKTVKMTATRAMVEDLRRQIEQKHSGINIVDMAKFNQHIFDKQTA